MRGELIQLGLPRGVAGAQASDFPLLTPNMIHPTLQESVSCVLILFSVTQLRK
jgi:hypothetical protein